MRRARQGGIHPAGDGNERDVEAQQRGQEIDQFIGLAAGAQREDGVAIGDDAEVAMHGIHGIEHHRGRTRAGERGGDFFADVAGFADADHDNLAAGVDHAPQRLDRAGEVVVQPVAHALELVDFEIQHAAALVEIVHGEIAGPGGGATAQKITLLSGGGNV